MSSLKENWLKIVLALFCVSALLIMRLFGLIVRSSNLKETRNFVVAEDLGHKLSNGINQYFREHTSVAAPFQILASLSMDISGVAALVHFMFKARSFKVIICIFIFYGT